jgi:hypothetical protein
MPERAVPTVARLVLENQLLSAAVVRMQRRIDQLEQQSWLDVIERGAELRRERLAQERRETA